MPKALRVKFREKEKLLKKSCAYTNATLDITSISSNSIDDNNVPLTKKDKRIRKRQMLMDKLNPCRVNKTNTKSNNDDERQSKSVLNMNELRFLDDMISTTTATTTLPKNTQVKSSKGKKYLLKREISHLNEIYKHSEFKNSSIKAIKQHVLNTIVSVQPAATEQHQ